MICCTNAVSAVEINNTLVYFISRPLTPPPNALQAVLPKLDLSNFLAAIFSTSLGDMLKAAPRTTILMPHNAAFKRLGLLVSEHLLGSSSQVDLERVIKHHVIDGVYYAGDLETDSPHTFATLEGTDVKLERTGKGKNATFVLSPSGGWPGMQSQLYTANMLTQTGVVHEMSDVMIPRSVDLTVGKLAKAAQGTTMAGLVVKAGLDWVLNGTAPPEGSSWYEDGVDGAGWTLLCPKDDAFKKFNLTQLYEDKPGLLALVSQHLIKAQSAKEISFFADLTDVLNNNRPLALDESGAYSTLLSPKSNYGDIIFRPADEGYVVGVKGARGAQGRVDVARVLSWGRATTGGGEGGVIQLDRVLMPYRPPWWLEYGAPAAVGVIGSFIILGFFLGVRTVWKRDTTEATYEPVGGFGHDDDGESG